MSALFATSYAAGRGKYLRKHSDSLVQLLVLSPIAGRAVLE